VPRPDPGEWIPIAAGERIVAFARPGKPLAGPFLGTDWTAPVCGKHPGFSRFATVLKARWSRDGAGVFSGQVDPVSRKVRLLTINVRVFRPQKPVSTLGSGPRPCICGNARWS